MTFARFNRIFHHWGAVIVAIPLLLVVLTGFLLLLKKEVGWIQPPTQRGASSEIALTFDKILDISKTVSEADIQGWDDIDRIDVRPSRGMLKVRAENRWEIQLDAATGEILQVAYRRSALIESLHDGTFLHPKAKLWVFFPSAVVLLGMIVTGIYLFIIPYLAAARHRRDS